MTILATHGSERNSFGLHPVSSRNFAGWKAELAALGIPPIIAIAGSRGKTTTLRLLDAIFAEAGLATAIWTDRGVEVEGALQRGELVPWSRALSRLADGSLDVAIQELDWDTVHAVGLPAAAYPLVAITNFCANNEACLVRAQSLRARQAMKIVLKGVHPEGVLVVNGEDYAVSGEGRSPANRKILVGSSREAPLIRRHLMDGGLATWIEGDILRAGVSSGPIALAAASDVGVGLDGVAYFQLLNALTAAAISIACGIESGAIRRALSDYVPAPTEMPGSFNVFQVAGATVVVDRPSEPWFLRPALRTLSHLPAARLIRLVGRLEPVADEDLYETGRLLGRGGGVAMLHGDGASSPRFGVLRQGIAANDVPPLVAHYASERSAVAALLRKLRPDDLALILADRADRVVRTLERAAAKFNQAAPA